ncbi:hypothetical protein UYSO10_2215 [Kosakonia radicincitans]|nr:hypothetical protein UYSO10_2215 [Kosakonia radicincitans]
MHYGAIPGFVCVLQASHFERNVRITVKNLRNDDAGQDVNSN